MAFLVLISTIVNCVKTAFRRQNTNATVVQTAIGLNAISIKDMHKPKIINNVIILRIAMVYHCYPHLDILKLGTYALCVILKCQYSKVNKMFFEAWFYEG